MHRKHDTFGQALLGRANGTKNPIYFKIGENRIEKRSTDRYFQSCKDLTELEQQLMALCDGDLLDVGCATGWYHPCFKQNLAIKSTMGIDNSQLAIKAANKLGNTNCTLGDIFSLDGDFTAQKYDTITLFENNIGMGGTIEKTELLLKNLKSLLKPNGQILAMVKESFFESFYSASVEITYQEIKETILWAHVSIALLQTLSEEQGLNAKSLIEDKSGYHLVILRPF